MRHLSADTPVPTLLTVDFNFIFFGVRATNDQEQKELKYWWAITERRFCLTYFSRKAFGKRYEIRRNLQKVKDHARGKLDDSIANPG